MKKNRKMGSQPVNLARGFWEFILQCIQVLCLGLSDTQNQPVDGSWTLKKSVYSRWSTAHEEKIKATRSTQRTAHSDGEGEAATHRDRWLRSRALVLSVLPRWPYPRATRPSLPSSTFWKSAKISPICHPGTKTLKTGREGKNGSNQITEENG